MRPLPRVLLITNERVHGDAAGQIHAYQELEVCGEIGHVTAVSACSEVDPAEATATVLQAVEHARPDVAVLWTPGRFPGSRANFERIQKALGSASLLYWEGDPWHRAKPITAQMRWWMGAADVVFTTAGPPQATDFLAAGARLVQHVPNTYCHVKFRMCEAVEPPPVDRQRVTMIGSNLMLIPALTGVPGSFRRAELAMRLRRAVPDFDLRGKGWARLGLRAQPIEYARQADHIREGALSVIWDHWPYLPDYSSDRLPIALVAGRPHVTTLHPGMQWVPGQDLGLFQEASPARIVDVVSDLLPDTDRLSRLGRAAHRWAAHRVSHREAARYIMSTVLDSVASPPSDPWAHLPGPWTADPMPRRPPSPRGQGAGAPPRGEHE